MANNTIKGVFGTMKRVFVLTLASIGLLSVVLAVGTAVFVFGLDSGSDYKVESVLEAPDHQHTATLYTAMGGGAAGWCSQVISITTPSQPFSLSTESKSGAFQVFRANCSVVVHAYWLSPTQFQVGFSPGNDSGGVSVYMQERDNTGAISIKYALGAQSSAPADRPDAARPAGG